MTLIDSQMARQSGGFGPDQVEIQDLTTSAALAGVHLSGTDEPIFHAAQIRLENLAAWAGLRGVEHEFNEDGGESTAKITRPPAQEVETPDGVVRVSTKPGVFNFEELRDSVLIKGTVRTVLSIERHEKTTYTGFDRLTKALMDLLTLASGEPSGVIAEQLFYSGETTFPRHDEVRMLTRTAEVIREPFYRGDADAPSQDNRRFLFTCRDKSFAESVSRWLPLRARAVNACNVLFGLRYAPPVLTEIRLLTVAVAAEALHRALYPNTIPMLPENFERIREQALRSVKEEADRAWVNSKLRNEPSYRERMLDLASKPSPEAVDFIIPDREIWARNLGNSRNGLAHSAKGVDSLGMYEQEKVTEQLLYLVLMTELGLPADVQLRAVQGNSYMSYLAGERRRTAEGR
jgi:hypothetical protein